MPLKPSGVSWISELERFNDTAIEYLDEYQRARLRSLQAVDEMVRDLVQILEGNGVLDNTYIFYTTDNGFHIAQHRKINPCDSMPFGVSKLGLQH